MSLRSLQLRPISTSHYYTSGDVTIQAGVAIAPGVLIQADPNSQVIIKSGACIGIGAILHAHDGVVEIGEGANIGAEALLVGQVTIGANACIGAATTVFNSTIEAGQIVSPGSLIGDNSRPAAELKVTDTVIYPVSEPAASAQSTALQPPSSSTEIGAVSEEPAQPANVNVYGQVYVNRMFFKLFPHQSRGDSDSDESTASGSSDPWDD